MVRREPACMAVDLRSLRAGCPLGQRDSKSPTRSLLQYVTHHQPRTSHAPPRTTAARVLDPFGRARRTPRLYWEEPRFFSIRAYMLILIEAAAAVGGGWRLGVAPRQQEDPSQKPDPESACPSCWMRMTVNAVPSTPALGQKAAIPLGCILQPMAPSDEVRGRLSIRERERETWVASLSFYRDRSRQRLITCQCVASWALHACLLKPHTRHTRSTKYRWSILGVRASSGAGSAAPTSTPS